MNYTLFKVKPSLCSVYYIHRTFLSFMVQHNLFFGMQSVKMLGLFDLIRHFYLFSFEDMSVSLFIAFFVIDIVFFVVHLIGDICCAHTKLSFLTFMHLIFFFFFISHTTIVYKFTSGGKTP